MHARHRQKRTPHKRPVRLQRPGPMADAQQCIAEGKFKGAPVMPSRDRQVARRHLPLPAIPAIATDPAHRCGRA